MSRKLILEIIVFLAVLTLGVYFYNPRFHAPQAYTHPEREQYFGVYTHKLDQQGAEELAYIGANIVRTDAFAWDIIEKEKGKYDFSSTDQVVAWSERNSKDLLGILLYTPPWQSGTQFAPAVKSKTDCGIPPEDELHNSADQFRVLPPRNQDDFARFVYRTVRRYPQVRYWQIWNEPNNPIFWQPASDPAQYVKLLKAAYRAVKLADPQAKVVLGGLSLVDLRYLRGLYDSGAGSYFDILAVHPYNPAQSPAEYLENEMRNVQAVMNEYGDRSKKIWITEIGWHTSTAPAGVDEAVQAQFMNQLFDISDSMEMVQAIFWHTLEDCTLDYRPEEPEHNFGLFRSDHTPKPAAEAFRAVPK